MVNDLVVRGKLKARLQQDHERFPDDTATNRIPGLAYRSRLCKSAKRLHFKELAKAIASRRNVPLAGPPRQDDQRPPQVFAVVEQVRGQLENRVHLAGATLQLPTAADTQTGELS